MNFNTIPEALEDLRQGKIILVTDDPDRENEGDFICAALHHPAALCTQKKIVFSPSTHLRFVQSGFILTKPAAPVKQFCSQ